MQHENEFGQQIGAATTDWVNAFVPPTTGLIGDYCMIEPLDITEHANSLFNLFTTDEVGNNNWTYMPYGPFGSFSDFESWLMSIADHSDPFYYSILNTQYSIGK